MSADSAPLTHHGSSEGPDGTATGGARDSSTQAPENGQENTGDFVASVPEMSPTEAVSGNHDRRGRWTLENIGALKDGRYSGRAQAALLPGQEALREELDARVAEVLSDLGGEALCSRLKRDAIRSDARLWVLEETLWADIERNGAMSAKGRRRAATTALLNIIDRRMKLAALLTLERREKPVGAEIHERLATAERERQRQAAARGER